MKYMTCSLLVKVQLQDERKEAVCSISITRVFLSSKAEISFLFEVSFIATSSR